MTDEPKESPRNNGETCDYASVTPDRSHGLARHKVRGYTICDACYRAMHAAEVKWEDAQNAANFPFPAGGTRAMDDSAAPRKKLDLNDEWSLIDSQSARIFALETEKTKLLARVSTLESELREARADSEIAYDETSGEMQPALPAPIAKALAYFRAMSEPYYNGAILDDAEHQLRLAIVAHEEARPNPYIVKLALEFWIPRHQHEERSAYGREVRAALAAANDDIAAIEARAVAELASLHSSPPDPVAERRRQLLDAARMRGTTAEFQENVMGSLAPLDTPPS
jgi:hypothetical protein